MQTLAVVLNKPKDLCLSRLALTSMGEEDVAVEVVWSGISTGTERLLYNGQMPPFPGMGYPLVPGYESVGQIVALGARADRQIGEAVFVGGASCFGPVRGLFGSSAARLVVPSSRAIAIGDMEQEGVLLALAATAHHALTLLQRQPAELIVGHGVLGRLLSRLVLALGHPAPTVWEANPTRRQGRFDYPVISAADDPRQNYRSIIDVSGDAGCLDALIPRLAPGGEIVLAGFYSVPLSFAFPAAFMREACLKVAAQWLPTDLSAVKQLAAEGQLSLADLITHRFDAQQADQAYPIAFSDPACLKMILDWRTCQ